MGESYGFNHAAVLAVQLPETSRTGVAIDPRRRWDDAALMLRSVEYACRVLVWQRTKDGSKGMNKPRPLRMPGDRPKSREEVSASAETVAEGLGVEGMA